MMGRWREITERLQLPVMVAPMFLISGPEMVKAASNAGVIGCLPAPNARTIDTLHAWCADISAYSATRAPWALNLLMHSSYARFADEAEVVRQWKPDIVISAVGSPARIVDIVHDYGGIVLADVARPSQARKAIAAGADGLIIVCSGAGGHTGTYNPFAFARAVRSFWDGPLILSGGITDAHGIAAARMLGADLAYMGTRFLACQESLGDEDRKALVMNAAMEDIILSAAITGVPANWIRQSLESIGITPEMAATPRKMDFTSVDTAKPWKNIWGAGHGVDSVAAIEPLGDIVARLAADYRSLVQANAGLDAQHLISSGFDQ
jgi:nitronate monooxygenase